MASTKNMILVDVHCHLDFPEYDADREEVLKRAEAAGVKAILLNGVHPASNRRVIELCKKYPVFKPVLGYYPTHTVEVSEAEFDQELEWISKQEFIAFGEIGLDLYERQDKLDEMKKAFTKIVQLAIKMNKPIIVHTRKAELETIELIESLGAKKVDLHCFSGKKALIARAAQNGWYFSVPANIVRASNFQTLVEMVPIGQLLTETDSPHLSPFRGERNEPAFIVETIKKMAEIKKMDPEEVANCIWMNYQRLFS